MANDLEYEYNDPLTAEELLMKEQNLIGELAKITGHRYRKLGRQYQKFDYCIVDEGEEVTAFLELKNRECHSQDYDTTVVDLDKYELAVAYMKNTKIPFLFVFKFKNGFYTYLVDVNDKLLCTYTGRTTKTRSEHDIKPVIHIPTNKLHKVK